MEIIHKIFQKRRLARELSFDLKLLGNFLTAQHNIRSYLMHVDNCVIKYPVRVRQFPAVRKVVIFLQWNSAILSSQVKPKFSSLQERNYIFLILFIDLKSRISFYISL